MHTFFDLVIRIHFCSCCQDYRAPLLVILAVVDTRTRTFIQYMLAPREQKGHIYPLHPAGLEWCTPPSNINNTASQTDVYTVHDSIIVTEAV